MNIAFTTILLFILLAPGFIARQVYHSSKLSIRNPNKNIVTELTLSIIPAFFIQIIALSFVENLSVYKVDFAALGSLIIGSADSTAVRDNFQNIDRYKYPIFFYNFIVFGIAVLLGYLSREIVRKAKWDRKYRYLRFTNKWHYIFSGECLDFPDVPDDYEDITDKTINVLCKVNGKTILYSGKFFDYYININGDLEAVHLKFPIRRLLDDDKVENYNEKYYAIESRYLVIPNNEILNINFRYFKVQELDSSQLTVEEIENAIELS